MLFFQTEKNNNKCTFALLNPDKYDNEKFWFILKEKGLINNIFNQIKQFESIEVYIYKTNESNFLILTPECFDIIFSKINSDLSFFINACMKPTHQDKIHEKHKIKNTKSTLQNILGYNESSEYKTTSILNDTILSLLITFSTLAIYAVFPIIALSIGISVCAYILYNIQKETSYPFACLLPF